MLFKLLQSSKIQKALRCAIGLLLLVVVFSPALAVLGTPTVAHAQAAGGTGAKAPDPNAGFCSQVSTCLTSVVYLFTVYWTSGLVYVGSYIFNFGLQLGLNSTSYALDFLSQGWAMVRDIANLAFVFIIIYIAYTIIVEAETSGTMKTLAMVIVMALLINFSFFLTRIVIDAGNILAIQFYNAIDVRDPTNPAIAATKPSPLAGGNPLIKDLSAGIMNAVQIQGIMGDKSFQQFTAQRSGFGGFLGNIGVQIIVFTAVAIMFALIAFVFFSVGVQFLIRIITLWFVIIFAPLAFAAKALPHVKYAKEGYMMWQKHLIESSFYPAIFLFMFLIITMFLKELAGTGGVIPSIFNTALGTQGFEAIFTIIAGVGVRVGLLVIMMFAALKFSNSFSSHGSAAAQNVASWAGSKAAQVGAGTSAWAARNTAGRAANAASRSQFVRDWSAANPLLGGRLVAASLKGVANSNLDVRGISGLKSVLGKVNIDAGNASKTSFVKQVADRAKNVEARAKDMKSDSVDIEKSKPTAIKELKREAERLQSAAHAAELGGTEADRARFEKQAKEVEAKIADPKKLTAYAGERLRAMDKARIENFAKRIGEPSIGNAGFPSRGSIAGAAKIRGGGKSDVEEAREHYEHALLHASQTSGHESDHGKKDEHSKETPKKDSGKKAQEAKPHDAHNGDHLLRDDLVTTAQRAGGLGRSAGDMTNNPIFNEITKRLKESNRLSAALLEETRRKGPGGIQPAASRPQIPKENIRRPQAVNKSGNGTLKGRSVDDLTSKS